MGRKVEQYIIFNLHTLRDIVILKLFSHNPDHHPCQWHHPFRH